VARVVKKERDGLGAWSLGGVGASGKDKEGMVAISASLLSFFLLLLDKNSFLYLLSYLYCCFIYFFDENIVVLLYNIYIYTYQ
jgi:hypothetical protein